MIDFLLFTSLNILIEKSKIQIHRLYPMSWKEYYDSFFIKKSFFFFMILHKYLIMQKKIRIFHY